MGLGVAQRMLVDPVVGRCREKAPKSSCSDRCVRHPSGSQCRIIRWESRAHVLGLEPGPNRCAFLQYVEGLIHPGWLVRITYCVCTQVARTPDRYTPVSIMAPSGIMHKHP